MTIPIGSLAGFMLGPRGRHENDRSAAEEHNATHFDDALPPGLQLQWLGTAGFRIEYEGTHVLIDPYLTRSDLQSTMARHAMSADEAVISRVVPEASAVLVGHTHFDHALDVPSIARRTGCQVYGSTALRHLMNLHGLGDSAVEVQPGRVYEVGPFEIRFVESVHSKLMLGLKVPYDGEFTCDHLDGLRGGQYRCGQVYGIHIRVAGMTFYHQGSANLIDDNIQDTVDCFLCGIAGRGFTPHYAKRILSRLEPRLIIPNHFDDFFRPLSADMGFSFNVNFGGFLDEVRAVSDDFRVRALRPLQTLGAPC